MSNILLSIPCFHDLRYSDSNVSSCRFIINTDDKKYHVTHLKDHLNYAALQHFNSTFYHYTKNDLIDEYWEEVSDIPLNSLYSIDKRTNITFILELVSQLIQWFCRLTTSELFYYNITVISKHIHFLQNNATFVYSNNTPRFIQLNRFQIKSASLMTYHQKKRTLISQVCMIPLILKVLFFTKNKKASYKTLEACSDHCKLVNYSLRFLLSNDDLHIVQNMHSVYCNTSSTEKIQSFEALSNLVPSEQGVIHECIAYLNNI